MKKFFLLIVVFFLVGCVKNPSKLTRNIQNTLVYLEERSLNYSKDLPETKIIHTLEELVKIYGELSDPSYPKSAPIPSFNPENESMIFINPNLKDRIFGEIEIIKMKMVDNPILIIRIESKSTKVLLDKQ
jgi:hypothetical protein